MTSFPTPEPAISEPTGRDGSWVGRHSTALGTALVVVVLAVLAVVGYRIFFASDPAEAGSMATLGIMGVSDGDSAVLVAQDLLPGVTADGDAVLENVGSSEADFTLTAGDPTNTPSEPPLSDVLDLEVLQDGATIYSGPLSGFADVELGTWAPGEKQHFTFTVTLAADAGAEYQGARCEVPFSWTAADGS